MLRDIPFKVLEHKKEFITLKGYFGRVSEHATIYIRIKDSSVGYTPVTHPIDVIYLLGEAICSTLEAFREERERCTSSLSRTVNASSSQKAT